VSCYTKDLIEEKVSVSDSVVQGEVVSFYWGKVT